MGRAVALRLALDGVDVVCCTSSDERFASLQEELEVLQRIQRQRRPAATGNRQGRLSRARRVDEGVHYRLWVVGKFDNSVRCGRGGLVDAHAVAARLIPKCLSPALTGTRSVLTPPPPNRTVIAHENTGLDDWASFGLV